MNYDTKSYRKKNGIPMWLPVGYRDVWLDRLPEIKSMAINRVSMTKMAEHFDCTLGALASAMKYHGVSAIRVRHEHKKSITI